MQAWNVEDADQKECEIYTDGNNTILNCRCTMDWFPLELACTSFGRRV